MDVGAANFAHQHVKTSLHYFWLYNKGQLEHMFSDVQAKIASQVYLDLTALFPLAEDSHISSLAGTVEDYVFYGHKALTLAISERIVLWNSPALWGLLALLVV